MFGNYDTLGGDSSGASTSFAATRAPESEERASADQSPVIGSESSGQQPDISSREDRVSALGDSQSAPQEVASTSSPETPVAEAPAAADESASVPSSEELNQLMEQYAAPQQAPTEGEIVEGRVVAVADVGVVVDIGGKTEALIPAGEFMEADQPIQLDPGQNIEVQLTGEHKDGYLVVSYQRARRRRVWANLDKAYHDKTTLTGRIVDRVKGGLVVDVGVRAFLPASQVDLRPIHELEEWKDREHRRPRSQA